MIFDTAMNIRRKFVSLFFVLFVTGIQAWSIFDSINEYFQSLMKSFNDSTGICVKVNKPVDRKQLIRNSKWCDMDESNCEKEFYKFFFNEYDRDLVDWDSIRKNTMKGKMEEDE